MKKSLFYVISSIVLIIFFNLIQELSFRYIAKHFAEKKMYDLIKKYIDETNHLRSHVDYSICTDKNKPQCLLFNKISNKKNKTTIYINGDSWAQGFVPINNSSYSTNFDLSKFSIWLNKMETSINNGNLSKLIIKIILE